MTLDAQDWLPETAFEGFTAVAPLSNCLSGWSKAWLPEDELEADPKWTMGIPLPALIPQIERPGFALLARAQNRMRLATALLGNVFDRHGARTDADHALIDLLIEKALTDLADRVGEGMRDVGLPVGTTLAEHDLTIALRAKDGTDLIHVATCRNILIALLKRRSRPPRQGQPLAARLTTVAAKRIELGALVGRASLTFQELQCLEVGDVVTLDDRIDERRDLLIAGRNCARDCVAIAANDDRLSLIIERAVGQW